MSDRPGRWWAVYTRSKAEKALARHLYAREVSYYLPLEHKTWRQNGRRFTSHLPLFPGYIFLHGNENDRVTALESNLISRILVVPDQERLWSDLRRVDRVLGSDVDIDRCDVLIPGKAVVIVAGPFEGMQGVLLRRGARCAWSWRSPSCARPFRSRSRRGWLNRPDPCRTPPLPINRIILSPLESQWQYA